MQVLVATATAAAAAASAFTAVGCFWDAGCDGNLLCTQRPTVGDVGEVDPALLSGATVEVCIDNECETTPIIMGMKVWASNTYVEAWDVGDETMPSALIKFEYFVPQELKDIDSPAAELRLRVSVLSADQQVLMTGTWVYASETKEDGGVCDKTCRESVFYRSI